MTHPPRKGFSIPEVLIAITLAASLLLLFDRILLGGYRFISSLMNGQTDELRVLRARELITDTLSRVAFSDRGAFPIASATPNDLTVYADRNRDGSKERIRIWRDGASIFLSATHPVGIPPSYTEATSNEIELLTGADTTLSLLSYYDDHGNDLGASPDPGAIRRIDIVLSRGTPTELDRDTVVLPSFSL